MVWGHILSLIISVVAFAFILSILVIIHEAGHFFMARRFGIKVEEFGFGFPPKIWGRKRGETLYSVNALPIGGFVKLYGEDSAGGGKVAKPSAISYQPSADLDRAFFAKPAHQRAVVILAGVLMNAVLAFGIYYVFLTVSNFKTDLPLINANHKFYLVDEKIISDVYVGSVSKNSPAQKLGLGDISKIVSVNKVKVRDSADFISKVNANKGKEILLQWQDSKNKYHSGKVIPRANPPKGQGPLGVALASADGIELSYSTPGQKILSGITHPVNMMLYSLDGLRQIVASSIKTKSTASLQENLSGPVGIFVVVGAVVSSSPSLKDLLLQGLNLAGLISISLAFFNVLPIPALDGGRLFFILLEMVTRKKINPKREAAINTVGFIVLLSLLLYITVFFDFPKLLHFIQFLFKG